MIQAAVGIAGLLVMLILSAGAACWTVVLLKGVATSRRLPESLTGLAWQILTALQVKPDAPLIPWSPRRPVPWAIVDLVGALALYIAGIVSIRLVLDLLGWVPGSADEDKLSLDDKALLVGVNIVLSLGLLAAALPLIALRTGAKPFDFGFARRELWSDLKLGLTGFVMLAPPVYAIQGVLVYFWQPSKHPLMEMFKESPDASFFAVLFVAAAVVAPIFEELVFRVLLQGFLEKAFSHRSPLSDLVAGSSGQNPGPGSLPPADPAAAEAGIVYFANPQGPDTNPYFPSAIVSESGTPVQLVSESEQPMLRGVASWLPIGITSIVFALLHFSHGPDWVALTLLAAGMGYLYQRTHRVVPSLIVHALLNGLSMFGLWLQVYGPPELRQ
jgi:membrane protease YdiL (CAAX protease family)